MKHYVVWKGREVWIFDTWDYCKRQVEWFSGAKYKSFKTYKEAQKAFNNAPSKSIGKKVQYAPKKEDTSFLLPTGIWALWSIIENSLVVDWACQNSTTGNMEFQGILMNTWEYVFQSKVYKWGTNNIAEFLALYEAIIWAEINDFDWVIFSDSKIAISWVKKWVCNTNYRKLKNKELQEYIEKALDYLQNVQMYDKIYRWNTKEWGENPADYGRK